MIALKPASDRYIFRFGARGAFAGADAVGGKTLAKAAVKLLTSWARVDTIILRSRAD
jgi:hypothetical protein